ncbi:Mov34/MPN/PAD-1 family protein [Streptomyces sp. NPDC003691]
MLTAVEGELAGLPETGGRGLTIGQSVYDAIVAHARADHPDLACGLVTGPVGSGRPERHLPITNAAHSPTVWEMDSGELVNTYRSMDDRDEEVVIVYHSNTATEAYPSRMDIRYANEPGAHYVIVSTMDPDTVEFRAFRIIDGKVWEEPVRIVPSTP